MGRVKRVGGRGIQRGMAGVEGRAERSGGEGTGRDQGGRMGQRRHPQSTSSAREGGAEKAAEGVVEEWWREGKILSGRA